MGIKKCLEVRVEALVPVGGYREKQTTVMGVMEEG